MTSIHSARVQSLGQAQAAKESAHGNDHRAGSRNGVKLVPVNKADPQVAPMVLPSPQDASQALPARTVSASERRVSAETAPPRKSPSELFQNAHTQGLNIVQVRQGARALVGGTASWSKWSGSPSINAKTKLMAGRVALASLEDGVSDDELAAMLTPVAQQERDPRDPHKPQDLIAMIRSMAAGQDEAKDGDEAFEHFLNDVLAGLDTTSMDDTERTKLLRELREADRHDDATIMRALRKLQGFKELHQEDHKRLRETRRQEVLDLIGNQVHDGREGAVALASFNAAPAAADLSDPEVFIKTFSDLVTQEHTFNTATHLLIQRFPLDTLTRGGIIDKLKQAVAEDLASATSLRNGRWIYEAASDLGHLKVLSTLIEFIESLAVQLGRTPYVQPAQAH
ncbi:MAG: hypothetical protein EOO28_16435 [Comamonadaceae bacterium]|nr:MAG: hypothetical protein EOO28_16435 [Comamonadaceae bacterium]